jgi:hypothetical protein
VVDTGLSLNKAEEADLWPDPRLPPARTCSARQVLRQWPLPCTRSTATMSPGKFLKVGGMPAA